MLSDLSNEILISRLKSLVLEERTALVALLEHLAEFDERKLYSDLRYPSLFAYCVSELGYSEQATAKRVYTARAVRKYPVILDMLRNTELNMTSVMILGPHLTADNHLDLLSRIRRRSSREVEALVASLAPGREVAECVRRVPPLTASLPFVAAPVERPDPVEAPPANESSPVDPASPFEEADPSPAVRQVIESSGPQGLPTRGPVGRQSIDYFAAQRVHFGFNGSEAFLAKYERARELLRHKYPAGKLEDILTDALEALLDKKDPDRWKTARAHRADRPRADNRTIPRFVKTIVWARDSGRCVFAGPDGILCGERGGLEFDHITPFAFGGRSDDPKNIRLLCRTHNQLAARRIFGEEADRSR